MDYKEFSGGLKENNFWHESKSELIDFLFSKFVNKDIKILNIGSGVGNDLKILKKYGKVYVVDIDRQALKCIKDRSVLKKVGDACRLDLPSDYFDVVASLDVFEHIENDNLAFNECKRVLKQNGFLIFTVPAFPLLYSSYDGFLEHRRRYNKKMLMPLISNLEIKSLGYWNCILFVYFVFDRLLKKKIQHKGYYISDIINVILRKIMKFENFLIKKGIMMPIGLTIYCVAQKK